MTIIEQIKAEIERLIVKHELEYTTAGYVMNELLSFLSTLESENPLGLEEEIHKYNKERFDEYFPEQDGDFISEVDFMTCLDRVARHFAQWQKEHMMKEAVEGEVVKDWDNNLSVKSATISGFKFGEKVRVIVLPKED